MLTPDTVLGGRYRIVRQIGGGGMGVVYLAEDIRLPGRRCAIKEMSLTQLAPGDRQWAVDAFRQEAQILARLRHPGLASVTDFFPEGETWYLVMDFIEGETLRDHLQRAPGGRLPLQEALGLVRQLCEVLEYLHGQSPPVVFRDLKPGNVMLTPRGEVRLIDFGIARFFKPGQPEDTVSLGTPGYAAPEQFGGLGQTDPRSDIYSLGVLLHQLLTGYDPTTTPFNLPSARTLNSAIPPQVEAIIRRSTQMRPDLRFQGVAEFCQALFAPTEAVHRAQWPPAPPAGPPSAPPRGRPARSRAVGVWIGVGIGVTVLLGLCVLAAASLLTPRLSGLGGGTAWPTAGLPPAAAETAQPTVTAERPGPARTASAERGLRIAYVRGNVGNTDVYVAGADGSGAVCVACSPCDEAEPAWSPQGDRIIYQSNCAGSYDIWLAGRATGALRPLTADAETDEREPDWSPDGSRIAYRVSPVGDNPNADGDLWVMHADGSGARSLGLRGRSPVWSPDGQRLALMSERSGSWQVYIYDLRSGQVTQMTQCDTNCRWPCWSPDGRYLAYHSTTAANSAIAEAIWYVPAEGGRPVLLVRGHHAGRPAWSVDGLVAFNSDLGIEVVAPDGSGRRVVIAGDQNWAPAWSVRWP